MYIAATSGLHFSTFLFALCATLHLYNSFLFTTDPTGELFCRECCIGFCYLRTTSEGYTCHLNAVGSGQLKMMSENAIEMHDIQLFSGVWSWYGCPY